MRRLRRRCIALVSSSTGPGAFAAPALIADGHDPLFLASADLNGDNLSDVVSTSYSDGTLAVFFDSVQTPGTFSTPLILSSPGASQVAVGDLNGDGLNDLVITDPGPTGGSAPTVSVLLQDAAHPGQFLAAVSYATAVNSLAQSIVVTDVNGDGLSDIVTATGVSQTLENGVITNKPGVLLQSASSPGTFGALQDLP